jgi:hypothetical protein
VCEWRNRTTLAFTQFDTRSTRSLQSVTRSDTNVIERIKPREPT